MTFDTLMEGSPASVDAAAGWLESLERSLGAGRQHTLSARRLSDRIWSGRAANGYRDFAGDLVEACEEVEGRAHSAADRFRSYALQLKWRQEDMEKHRQTARNGGLTVAGTIVKQPPAVFRPTKPADDAPPSQVERYTQQVTEYNAAVKRIDLYSTVKTDVTKTFDRLDNWVVDNLVPEEEKVKKPSKAGVMAAGIKTLGPVADLVITSSEHAFKTKSTEMMSAAVARATRDAAAKSGNPAVRAGRKPPREEAVAKRLARRKAPKVAEKLGKISKGLGIVGLAVTVALGGAEIAAGASPSSVGVETVAGAVGGAAVIGLATLVGVTAAPAIAVGIGAVVVGGLVAWGAGAAYQHFVPQATREKIDEGIRDAGAAVGGFFRGLFR